LFPEREDVQLLNGRWGAYLKIGKDNFKLPKGTEAEKLTLEECLVIAEGQTKGKKSFSAKKATPAKTTAKKAPVKKTVKKKVVKKK